MAVTYLDRAHYAANHDFSDRLKISIVKVALAVQGEVFATPQSVFDKRAKLAALALTLDTATFDRFRWTVLASAAVTVVEDSAAGDTALDTAVTNVWNDLAGVLSTDT